jgi:hypothetical protein
MFHCNPLSHRAFVFFSFLHSRAFDVCFQIAATLWTEEATNGKMAALATNLVNTNFLRTTYILVTNHNGHSLDRDRVRKRTGMVKSCMKAIYMVYL